jgi:hypothetical protein
MGLLDKLFKKKEQPKSDECVLIHLDGIGLPDQVYQECDTSTLEDQLIDAIARGNAGSWTDMKRERRKQQSSNMDQTLTIFTKL